MQEGTFKSEGKAMKHALTEMTGRTQRNRELGNTVRVLNAAR